jgi:uncharacterized membrane protein YfcA
MVPFLYFFLAQPEISGAVIPAADQAVVAHATSLAVIIPISLRGTWLYHRAGRVDWDSVWRMGLSSILFAVIGARVAVVAPGQALKISFGVFLLIVATRLVLGKKNAVDRSEIDAKARTTRALIGGAMVGFFSALLGVGGGLVAIPVLIYWLHLPIEKVSATSLAVITFTAATGVATYVVSGQLAYPEAGGAFTYFHLWAALALAIGAFIAVPLGTEAQLRMPTDKLRYVFAVVFFLLGGRIVITNLLALLQA